MRFRLMVVLVTAPERIMISVYFLEVYPTKLYQCGIFPGRQCDPELSIYIADQGFYWILNSSAVNRLATLCINNGPQQPARNGYAGIGSHRNIVSTRTEIFLPVCFVHQAISLVQQEQHLT